MDKIFTIKDKYDGLKLNNRTIPWSKVASGAALDVAGGVAGGDGWSKYIE